MILFPGFPSPDRVVSHLSSCRRQDIGISGNRNAWYNYRYRQMPGWRNGRRCGFKILIPASYLMIPSDTKQYLSTFQPSKQAYVLLHITRRSPHLPRIFGPKNRNDSLRIRSNKGCKTCCIDRALYELGAQAYFVTSCHLFFVEIRTAAPGRSLDSCLSVDVLSLKFSRFSMDQRAARLRLP